MRRARRCHPGGNGHGSECGLDGGRICGCCEAAYGVTAEGGGDGCRGYYAMAYGNWGFASSHAWWRRVVNLIVLTSRPSGVAYPPSLVPSDHSSLCREPERPSRWWLRSRTVSPPRRAASSESWRHRKVGVIVAPSDSLRHRDAAAVAGLRNPTPSFQTPSLVEGKPIRSYGSSQAGIL